VNPADEHRAERSEHDGEHLEPAAPADQLAGRTEQLAETAARQGDYARAADLAADSVRLTPTSETDDAARRALREVEFRAAAGETTRAIALADQLVAALDAGHRRAEAMSLRVFLDFADSEPVLRRALDDVREDPVFRARTLDLLGWQLGLYRGRLAEGTAASTKALALSRALGDAETTRVAAATLAEQLLLQGKPDDALFAEAVDEATGGRPFPLGRWPRVFRARALLWSGQLEPARREFQRMQRDADRLGSKFQRPYRLCDLAQVAVCAGDLDDAILLAQQGITAASTAGNEHAVVWLAQPLGLAAATQGRPDRANWAADLLSGWAVRNDEPPRQTMADEIRGALAAARGDWPSALGHFVTMVERLEAMGYAHPGARPGLPRAIEAAAMVDDRGLCRALTERLRDQADPLRSPLVDAQLAAADGQLALLEGDSGRAVHELDASVKAFRQLGYRFEAARAGLALARGWLRHGRRAAARDAAIAAREIAEAAAAPGWVAAADELLRRCGPAGDADATGDDQQLTRTETQICALVTEGLRNQEIAARMFVAVSTVEAHLTRIYRKLGLRSRTELTMWFRSD
jgi:ATP/maltotriose-dependent transcriptional regulator MalT